MTFEADIYQYIAEQNPAIGDKLYPEIASQGALLPYAVYTVLEEHRPISLQLDNTHLVDRTMQIDCWAESQDDADTMVGSLRSILHNKSGQIGTVFVRGMFETSKQSQLVVPDDGTDAEIYGARITLRVWSEE